MSIQSLYNRIALDRFTPMSKSEINNQLLELESKKLNATDIAKIKKRTTAKFDLSSLKVGDKVKFLDMQKESANTDLNYRIGIIDEINADKIRPFCIKLTHYVIDGKKSKCKNDYYPTPFTKDILGIL